MGEKTAIEWCDKTFNTHWGCTKVSPACHHCYAETFSKRLGLPIWGDNAPRRFFSDAHWNEPVKWNRQACEQNIRFSVFCASMADVFEDRNDLAPVRARLFDLIGATPFLDWLLLTKRPEHVFDMTAWHWADGWPDNVALGVTVENKDYFERIRILSSIPAKTRFLSMEPLLGNPGLLPLEGIHAVIVGGESGPHARPMHPEWVRHVRAQCQINNVLFHFKQWGDWAPYVDEAKFTYGRAETEQREQTWMTPDGTRGGCWIYDDDGTWQNHFGNPPEDMKDVCIFNQWGKKRAGRMLDGRYWDDLPWRK